jgi:hypothetical protein
MERRRCSLEAFHRHQKAVDQLLERELEALKADRSTIQITLARRRLDDSHCNEEARCLADSAVDQSMLFEACLEDDGGDFDRGDQ